MAGADVHDPHSLFRRLLDSLPDPVFALDPAGHAVYLNPPAARLLGREPAALPGRPLWEEFPGGLGLGFEAQARRTLSDRAARRYEEHVPGQGAWLEVCLSPSPPGLVVTCRDVTARRRAEERAVRLEALTLALSGVPGETRVAPGADLARELASLRRAQVEREALLERQTAERARYEAVLQQQPVGVLVVDAGSGRVQFANRRFEELLGAEVQPGVASGAVLRHLQGPEGRPPDGSSLLGEALRQGRATVDQDLQVVREDGGRRPVWASAAPVRNRLGVVLSAVLTLDETEERWERLLPALAGEGGVEEVPPGPVTPEVFVRVVGRQLAALGHSPLEGRLAALLLLSAGGLTLTGAAERLHATKGALSRVMNRLLARGDVVVTREPSSREYHLELSGGTYLRDLLEKRALSLSIASLGYALLRDHPDLDPVVARRVREMADIRTRNALHLARLLEARQSAQRRAREHHLEGNWDAVSPRNGR